MAHIKRLIVAILLMALSSLASAACTKYYISWRGQETPLLSTKSAACSALNGKKVSGGSGTNYWETVVSGASINASGFCAFTERSTYPNASPPPPASESNGQAALSQRTVTNCGCPVGMEEDSSGNCVCKAGLEKGPDGICIPTADTECKSFYSSQSLPGGALVQDYRLQGNVAAGSVFCMPGQFDNENRGCKVVFDRQSFVDYGSGNAVTEGLFDGKPGDSGLSCNVGDVETPAKPEEEKCPSGYTGTVNGVEVCVNKVPDSGFEPGSDETTVDDGENTTTTRTNTETNCQNGRCTTTTTVTTTVTNNATGATTTTSTNTSTTQSQESFCKANPKAKLCGGSGLPNVDGGGSGGGGNGEEDPSSFTGACAGGFQCKGDAIQCAIAREQHIRACRLFDKESPESKLYEEFKGKEGDQTKELPGNETVAIGDKINTTDALGAGGTGLSDLNLTVWNQQVSLPLSMLNQYLAAMGNVLLAVSFLLAFRIVARG